MEVGKNQNLSICLATYWNKYKTLTIGKKEFRNLANLSHFFHEKSFLYGRNHIFQAGI